MPEKKQRRLSKSIGVVHRPQTNPGRPFQPGCPPGPPRTGKPNRYSREFKEWLSELLKSGKYQEEAEGRIIAGKAPHLELLGAHWMHGKPKETVEVETGPSMAKLLLLAAQHNAGIKSTSTDQVPAEPAKED